ncbi:MAG: fibronectin type III domain-containing protein, partial [Bacteroidales bacterium]|nr:fibronectin type III domain-containing protein [Bacteroidales bacterium]
MKNTYAQSWLSYYDASQGDSVGEWKTLDAPTSLVAFGGDVEKHKVSASQSIGFTLVMGPTACTQFYVTADGKVGFGASPVNTDYDTVLAKNASSPFVVGMGCAGAIATSEDFIRTQLFGTAGDRIRVIEFSIHDTNNYSGTPIHFQIQLYEATSEIRIVYAEGSGAPTIPYQIGIRDADGKTWYINNGYTDDVRGISYNNGSVTHHIDAGFVPAGNHYFSFIPPLPCPAPKGLRVLGAENEYATLAWSVRPAPTTYIIEYGAAGFTPGTGRKRVGVLASPATIYDLSPDSTYDFYVQANCAVDVNSTNFISVPSMVTAHTSCAKQPLPYVENFDRYNVTGNYSTDISSRPANYGTTHHRPACWDFDNLTASNYAYVVSDGNNDGARFTFENTATSKAFVLNPAGNSYVVAVLPMFELPLDSLYIQFYHRNLNEWTPGNLEIGYTKQDGTGFVALAEIPASFDHTPFFFDYDVDSRISNPHYADNDHPTYYQNARIAIRYSATAGNHPVVIDNILVDRSTPCKRPTNFRISALTNTSATLSWNAVGTANKYKVEYGPVNYRENGIAATGSFSDITATEKTIMSLTAGREYDFYVMAQCTLSTGSRRTPPTPSPETRCTGFTATAVQATINENFDGAAAATVSDNDGSTEIFPNRSVMHLPGWFFPDTTNYFAADGHSQVWITSVAALANGGSGKALVLKTRGGHTQYAVMPYSGRTAAHSRLSFDYRFFNIVNGYAELGVMTSPYDFESFKTVMVLDNVQSYTSVRQLDFDQYGVTDADGYYIAIRYYYEGNNNNGALIIDNVSLSASPECRVPLTAVTNITNTEADVVLRNGATDVSFTVSITSPSAMGPFSSSAGVAQITGLSANTTYTYKVTASCGAEGPTHTFTTPCAPQTIGESAAGGCVDYNFNALSANGDLYPTAAVSPAAMPQCWNFPDINTAAGNGEFVFPQAYMTSNGNASGTAVALRSRSNRYGSYAVMPLFSVHPSAIYMDFYYKNNAGSYNGNLELGVMTNLSDTSTFMQLRTLPLATSWTQVRYSLDTARLDSNITYYIALRLQPSTAKTAQSAEWDKNVVFVDDFHLCKLAEKPILIGDFHYDNNTSFYNSQLDYYVPGRTVSKYIIAYNSDDAGDGEGVYGHLTIDNDVDYEPARFDTIQTSSQRNIFYSLVEGAYYSYRVKAVYPDGTKSPWSDELRFLVRKPHGYRVPSDNANNRNFNLIDSIICPTAKTLGVRRITQTSAEVYWTVENNDTTLYTDWTIEYGEHGFRRGYGRTIDVLATYDTVIHGLQPGIDYDVYVSRNCGVVIGFSNFLTTSFRTACAPQTIPYRDTLDNYIADIDARTSLTAATGTGALTNMPYNAVPDCWTVAGRFTGTDDAFAHAFFSSKFRKSGQGFVLHHRRTDQHHSGDLVVSMPPFADPIDTLRISFDFYQNAVSGVVDGKMPATASHLQIGYVTDGSAPETFVMLEEIPFHTSSTRYTYDFAGSEHVFPVGARIALRYPADQRGVSEYVVIDNVEINYSNCPDLQNLQAFGIPNGVLLTWDTITLPTEYVVNYGVYGESAETFSEVRTTATSIAITGLSLASYYSFDVRPSCSITHHNVLSHSGCGTRLLPYLEDFNSYGSGSDVASSPTATQSTNARQPACWTFPNTNVTNNVEPLTFVYRGTYSYNHDGNAMVLKSTCTGNDAYAVMPYFERPLTDLAISFNWRHYTDADTSHLILGYFTHVDGVSRFVEVARTMGPDTTWQYFTFDFAQSGLHLPADASIAFRYDGVDCRSNAMMLLDNVNVSASGVCPMVDNVRFSTTTDGLQVVGWTRVPNAVRYKVEYGLAGFALDSGNVSMTTTNADTLDLLPNTLYDFYISAYCSSTNSYGPMRYQQYRTPCGQMQDVPYADDFDYYGNYYTHRLSNQHNRAYNTSRNVNVGQTRLSYPQCWTLKNLNASGTATGARAYVTYEPGYVQSGRSLALNANCEGDTVVAVLPLFREHLNYLQLRLDYKLTGGNAQVGYITDLRYPKRTFTPAKTLSGGGFTRDSLQFTYAATDLGQTYYAAIRLVGTNACNSNNGLFIDNVVVTKPDCRDVNDTSVRMVFREVPIFDAAHCENRLGYVGPYLKWIGPADAMYYDVEYQLTDSLHNAYVSNTVGFDTFDVSSLEAMRNYNFHITTVCASSKAKRLISKTFEMPCTFYSLPLKESFETYPESNPAPAFVDNSYLPHKSQFKKNDMPLCWGYPNSSSQPKTLTGYNTSAFITMASSNAGNYYYSGRAALGLYKDAIVVLPRLDFDAKDYGVDFFWRFYHDVRGNEFDVNENEKASLGVMSNPNDPSTFVEIDALRKSLYSDSYNANTHYSKDTLDNILPAY